VSVQRTRARDPAVIESGKTAAALLELERQFLYSGLYHVRRRRSADGVGPEQCTTIRHCGRACDGAVKEIIMATNRLSRATGPPRTVERDDADRVPHHATARGLQ